MPNPSGRQAAIIATLRVEAAQFSITPMRYRGFPSKLHHDVPNWVEHGALFHIRVRLDRRREQRSLIEPALGQLLLESANFYQDRRRWHITIFLLLPDHLHALLSFPGDRAMSDVVGKWKHFHARNHGVIWQDNYFDHRLRDDERGEQLSIKLNYIRQNPVAAGLCAKPEDWPWRIDPFG